MIDHFILFVCYNCKGAQGFINNAAQIILGCQDVGRLCSVLHYEQDLLPLEVALAERIGIGMVRWAGAVRTMPDRTN